MYKQCYSEKSAQQQLKFEECLLDMMIEMHYDAISVSELCRRAGLSRKTFYRLFETKSDVLYALIDQRIIDQSDYTPAEGTGSGGLHQFFGYWRSQEKLLDALAKASASPLLAQRAILYTMKEAPDAQHMFGARSTESGWETMIYHLSGLFSLVLDWHTHGFIRPIDELCDLTMEILNTPPIKNPWLLDPDR